MSAVTGGDWVESESSEEEETNGVRQLWCLVEDQEIDGGSSVPGIMDMGGTIPLAAPQRNERTCLQWSLAVSVYDVSESWSMSNC